MRASPRRLFCVSCLRCATPVVARAPTRSIKPLTRDERHSLSRRDRALGRLKDRLGGRQIPFIETEWGQRKLRRQRIRAKAQHEERARREDVAMREQKRRESEAITASLPPLTPQLIEEAYQSLMAPIASTSTSTLIEPPALLVEPQLVPLGPLRARLGLEPPPTDAALAAPDAQPIDGTALHEMLAALEAASDELAGLGGSATAVGKRSTDRGLATSAEWQALLLHSAALAEPPSTMRILSLMERSGAACTSDTLKRACHEYARRNDVDGAETLLRMLEDGTLAPTLPDPSRAPLVLTMSSAKMPVDAAVHEAVLGAHVRVGDIVNAQFYLRALEERGLTPTEASYQIVIDALLTRKEPSAAWNLFSHCRAAAHPVPSEIMWASMIAACAPSYHRLASPERAFDLRQDMDDRQVTWGALTYAALITVCMRSGRAEYYVRGLTLLREMLNAGHRADRTLLEAVLEGAARQGDLARARWVFTRMAAAAEADESHLAPSSAALTSLLFAHARYPVRSLKVHQGPDGHPTPTPGTDNNVQVVEDQRAAESKDGEDGDDDILRFPGPMPRTKGEVVTSAQNLMQRYAVARGVHDLDVRPTLEGPAAASSRATEAINESRSSDPSDVAHDPVFAAMTLDVRVIDAYFEVICERSQLNEVYALYKTVYWRFGLMPSEAATSRMLQACLRHRKHSRAAEHASQVFATYVQTLGPNVLALKPGDGTAALVRSTIYTERIWSSIISMLSCVDQLEAAMKLTSQFAVLFPPSLMTRFARAIHASEERVPAAEVSLASPDYAETSSFHAGPIRPPRLVFEHVATLHRKLKARGAERGVRWLASIVRQYTLGTQFAERIIRGNDALPEASRGPLHLVGGSGDHDDDQGLEHPVVLEGPPEDELEPARQRMQSQLGVRPRQMQHALPARPSPLDRLEHATTSGESKMVPPPPDRHSVVTAIQKMKRLGIM